MQIFRGRIVDVSPEQLMIEISGQEKKIEAFIEAGPPLRDPRAGPDRPDRPGPRRAATWKTPRTHAGRPAVRRPGPTDDDPTVQGHSEL